jgi:radical SAM superfamily enzyme YgiQ (UPF0313 family)
MFASGYRKRDIESVIRDLRDKRQYGDELIFVDNEFTINRPQTKQLLRRIIEEEFGFNIIVFMRVENTKDDELLSLMAEAGVDQVYQGYESVQPETLIEYNKRQTLNQITAAIDKLHACGFHILGSFVLGADTDTPATIERTVEFATEQRLSLAYFFPIWGHFPEQINGYQTIVPWYRSIFRGWKYCDGNFVSHYPRHMPPSRLQRALISAHRDVYSAGQVLGAMGRGQFTDAKRRLLHSYVWKEMEKAHFEHVSFLEELEEGLYDPAGRLLVERLVARVEKDPRWTFVAANRSIGTLGLSPLELPVPKERNVICVPPRLERKLRAG